MIGLAAFVGFVVGLALGAFGVFWLRRGMR